MGDKLYYAKLIPGVTGYRDSKTEDSHYEDHPRKLGWIQVFYEREIRWAKPVLPFAQIWIPSLEWIKKYGEYFDVLVEKIEGGEYLFWLGFMLNESKSYPPELDDFFSEYPYVRKILTENWDLSLGDKLGSEFVELKSTVEKFSLRMDNAESKISLTVNDVSLTMDKVSSKIVIQVPSGGIVYLGGEEASEFVLKGFDFQERFNNHTHIGNMGCPTSTPYGTNKHSPSTDLSEKVKSE